MIRVSMMTALMLIAPMAAFGQDSVATASSRSTFTFGEGTDCGPAIYDTTHAANQGAEITAAANGGATSMGDLIVLAGMERFVCEVEIDIFTLASTAPFDLTMTFYTDCTSSGAAGEACGSGPGAPIGGSTVTVTGITPPATGTLFTVIFPYPLTDLTGEADDTISVSVNASRDDVFWVLNETPVIGSQPAGEPPTSFLERCGSTGTNNGCTRNFGVNNNFAIRMLAMSTPVELQSFSVE